MEAKKEKVGQIRIIALMFLALPLLLVSCAQSTSPAGPNLQSNISPSPVTAISKKDSQRQEWSKLVDMASKEKTVVVYCSGTVTAARDTIIQAFREKYGIEVQFIAGSSAEIVQKLQRERRAGIYNVDINIGGATTFVNFFKPEGMLEKLDPFLILPEVVDSKLWLEDRLAYVDNEHQILAFGTNLAPQYMLNKERVTPGEVKTFRDFLNPKWKGKIALHDPFIPGAGSQAMAVIGSVLLGWDAIREMAKQEPVIIRDQRIQTEWVARGKYPLGFAVSLGIFAELQKAGAPLQMGVPTDTTYATSSGALVGVTNKAPHPQAAKLFVNWLLTKEGQTTIYRQMNLASRRLDVPTEGVNPELLPDRSKKYFAADSEDWLLKQPEYNNQVKQIFDNIR